ncbi:MAG: tyrosine-type recombinase/integrase [Candidatus Falkowbacteria bacterium]
MPTNQKTIIAYLNDYLDYLEIEKGLASESQKNYARFLQKFFHWLEENNLTELQPKSLTDEIVWRYRLYLSRQQHGHDQPGLKKSTQNYYLIALRSLLSYFIEKDITSLPPDKIKLAREKQQHQVTFLKLDQIEKLFQGPDLSTLAGLRDRAILESLFSTGLRVAELTRLDCDQLRIKPLTNFLEISVSGKGGKVRTVYFSERAIQALRAYIAARKDMDPALFINYSLGRGDGTTRRLTVRAIEDIVKKYTKLAGLPIMTSPHTLRHSYATDLLTQGVDLRLVQEFLGHSNIATTQIYTHVTNKQLSDIHQKFHGGKQIKN